MGTPLDAVTIEILRNKIASLVEEMHYHFYRSGYSTIIRESRDFSCVILDRDGRLIVAPPMFFHAPVYRHLVGRILEIYGGSPTHHSASERATHTRPHPEEPAQRASRRMRPLRKRLGLMVRDARSALLTMRNSTTFAADRARRAGRRRPG